MTEFIVGLVLGFLVGALLALNLSIHPATVGNHDCRGIMYNVTIDSVATDTVFGKSWRH